MKPYLFQIVFAFVLAGFLGCSSSEPEVTDSTNDIQAFLESNPDAVEKPEDVPENEDEIFAASDAGAE